MTVILLFLVTGHDFLLFGSIMLFTYLSLGVRT